MVPVKSKPWMVNSSNSDYDSTPSPPKYHQKAASTKKDNRQPCKIATAGFIFVEESGNADQTKSPTTRRKIRSQAKSAAPKMKKPIRFKFYTSETDTDQQLIPAARREKTSHQVESNDCIDTLFISPSSTGYERARMIFDFDIMSLSGLTSVHVGKGSSLALLEPKIAEWTRVGKAASYLDFVPMYYSCSTLVRSVVDCTLAQYQYHLVPESMTTELEVLVLYEKALKELQDALKDPEKCVSEEVMLATAIFQVYELLDTSAVSDRWSKHFRGLMKLIEMRGPYRCSSSLEVSVFSTHLGPIIAECFNHQLECFIQKPGWDAVLLSIANGDPLLVNILHAMHKCSAFAIRVKGYIQGDLYDPDLVDDIVAQGLSIKNLTALPKSYQCVHGTGHELIPYQDSLRPDAGSVQGEAATDEMLCSTWGIHIVVNRFITALRPLASNARNMEHETLTYAYSLMDLNAQRRQEAQESGTKVILENLCHHAEFTARLAIDTKDLWEQALAGDLDAYDICRDVIGAEVFETWTRASASKAPTRGAVVL